MPLSAQQLDYEDRFVRVALLAALVVGFSGLYPHLRWSLESRQLVWFFNSYDEGYYGWLSMAEMTVNRVLPDMVMHLLYWVSGTNTQWAMVLADFSLPLSVTLAACYMVRPLFTRPGGMVAGALFVMVSAECWALRSTSIPYSTLHGFFEGKILSLGAGMADIFQLGNQTSTFWLFRTPEPQVTWIIMFIALGRALRLVLAGPDHGPRWGQLAPVSLLAGCGYLFCALTVGAGFLLFSVVTGKSHRRHSIAMGVGGLLCLGVCLGLSLYAARHNGGESLIFRSHRPVVMISAILGLLAVGCALVRSRGRLQPIHCFSIALGLAPICMANQQMVTGHMIYLLNFENFGLAQVSAFALLTVLFSPPGVSPVSKNRPSAPRHPVWLSMAVSMLVCLLLGGIILRSQLLSYADYVEGNRLARSYALTLESLPATEEPIACDDFFETDTLAIRLGRQPAFLIARSMTFATPIARLKDPQDIPANSAEPRRALYSYLALTGVSPDGLSHRFNAITDPDNPSWQDRFMLGGFLYNHADFWAPLTHGRDTKLAWIKAQKNMIVEDYAQFLHQKPSAVGPIIFVMREDEPEPMFLTSHHAQPIDIPFVSTPIPMKAYRVTASIVPRMQNP